MHVNGRLPEEKSFRETSSPLRIQRVVTSLMKTGWRIPLAYRAAYDVC